MRGRNIRQATKQKHLASSPTTSIPGDQPARSRNTCREDHSVKAGGTRLSPQGTSGNGSTTRSHRGPHVKASQDPPVTLNGIWRRLDPRSAPFPEGFRANRDYPEDAVHRLGTPTRVFSLIDGGHRSRKGRQRRPTQRVRYSDHSV